MTESDDDLELALGIAIRRSRNPRREIFHEALDRDGGALPSLNNVDRSRSQSDFTDRAGVTLFGKDWAD